MGWIRYSGGAALIYCLASGALATVVSNGGPCAETLGRLGIDDEGYAPIEVVRASQARIVYLNAALLRHDFPSLRDLSDAALSEFVLQHFAYVTRYANDNRGIHHSGIPVDEADVRRAIVPATYGRAFVLESTDRGVTIDMKGTGVTYVSKTSEGGVSIAPGSVKFDRGATHQNGLAGLPEGLYEIAAGEALEAVARDGSGRRAANRVYFEIDLGARLYVHDDSGEIVRTEKAVAIGRQPHKRLFRAGEEKIAAARRAFLARNARLFWRGLFHGSLNRYNAEEDAYLDYGTFTGVPREAYRLTVMAFVPYGLSDFYGLFGEWSAGQVATEKGRRLSPFYPRSWGVFLANLGVALGLGEDEVWTLAERNHELGESDLHELLQEIQAGKPERPRWDPTGKTKSVLDLVELQDWGTTGLEALSTRLDTVEIYRALFLGATRSEAIDYGKLLERAARDPERGALARLAAALARVEAILRESFPPQRLADAARELGSSRFGEALVRRRLTGEARHAAESVDRGLDARALVERWVARLGTGGASADSLPGAAKRAVDEWARSGRVDATLARFESANASRDLWLVVPPAASVKDSRLEKVLDSTIGLVWRDTRPAGEQFGHSYLRVGREIFDLQVARTERDDFLRMLANRFFYDFQMLGRSGNTPYYEVLFPISNEAREELLRYYRDRAHGRATVGGRVVTPRFDVSGKGEPWGDGIPRENCGAFATSFNRGMWHGDYPRLALAVADTGLSEPLDGATVALQSLFYPGARPLAVVGWGSSHLRGRPEGLWEAVGFTGWPHRMEALTRVPLAPEARHATEAARTRRWAESLGLAGFEATSLPALSKTGALLGDAFRFNAIRLEGRVLDRFSSEIAPNRVTIWWRWEPNGQFGHSWISVGDRVYDQAFGDYRSEPLADFLRREEENGFRLNGHPTFFVGAAATIPAEDIARLRRFFDARVAGTKEDGTALPRPGYAWEQPLVDGEITGERCGMFNSSFGNRAWQALFPELELEALSARHGLRYSDGSLFVLHTWFHRATGARDVFVLGPPEHVRREGFVGWDLPVDSLPQAVRETMRGAWQAVDRDPY